MSESGAWSFVAGMVAGPVVFWIGVALWCWILWACRRTTGYDECVGNCGSPAREIGDLPNGVVWWLQLWHRVWWSYRPSHRRQVQAYWEGLRPAVQSRWPEAGVHVYLDSGVYLGKALEPENMRHAVERARLQVQFQDQDKLPNDLTSP